MDSPASGNTPRSTPVRLTPSALSRGQHQTRSSHSSSLLEDVLADKKMALMQSPEVISFLQNMQAQLREDTPSHEPGESCVYIQDNTKDEPGVEVSVKPVLGDDNVIDVYDKPQLTVFCNTPQPNVSYNTTQHNVSYSTPQPTVSGQTYGESIMMDVGNFTDGSVANSNMMGVVRMVQGVPTLQRVPQGAGVSHGETVQLESIQQTQDYQLQGATQGQNVHVPSLPNNTSTLQSVPQTVLSSSQTVHGVPHSMDVQRTGVQLQGVQHIQVQPILHGVHTTLPITHTSLPVTLHTQLSGSLGSTTPAHYQPSYIVSSAVATQGGVYSTPRSVGKILGSTSTSTRPSAPYHIPVSLVPTPAQYTVHHTTSRTPTAPEPTQVDLMSDLYTSADTSATGDRISSNTDIITDLSDDINSDIHSQIHDDIHSDPNKTCLVTQWLNANINVANQEAGFTQSDLETSQSQHLPNFYRENPDHL